VSALKVWDTLDAALVVVVEPALGVVTGALDEEPPAVVVPALGDALPVEAAPELEAEPDPDVLTTVGATPCVAPLPVAPLLPPHAAINRKAAQIVGAAAQFLSDKSLFISVILRCEFCPRIMLTSLIERSLSLCGDCLRSATISVAE
jgi:hypothetical protein